MIAFVLALLWHATPPPWSLPIPVPDDVVAVGPKTPTGFPGQDRWDLTFGADARIETIEMRWGLGGSWDLIEIVTDPITFAFTREREGQRVLLSVTPRAIGAPEDTPLRGVLFYGPRPTPGFARPTPCVEFKLRGAIWHVNSSGVDHHGEFSHSSARRMRRSLPLMDVDGDLVLDWIVPASDPVPRCPEDVRWEVWRAEPADGHCGHLLGVIGPGDVVPDTGAATLDFGLRRIVTESKTTRLTDTGHGVVPEMVTETRIWQFDGNVYQERSAETKRGICHHCATWTCSPPELIGR